MIEPALVRDQPALVRTALQNRGLQADALMAEPHQLTELQIAIMRILWERKEATVAEIHAALLDERGLAPTTVATLLSRLEKRGAVKHLT